MKIYDKNINRMARGKQQRISLINPSNKAAGCLYNQNYFYSNTNALACSIVKVLKKKQLRR
jgi:hypothetical protein